VQLASLFCFFMLLVPTAQAAPNDTMRNYPVSQVAPGTYVMHGPLGDPSVANQGFMNNPAWIIAGDQVVVIDPGSSVQAGRRVVKEIKRTTSLPVTTVFDTHFHGDHWLGNQAILDAWPKAVVMAQTSMVAWAATAAPQSWVERLSNMTQGYTDGTRAVLPTIALKDGEQLRIGNRRFTFHAPLIAHSKTDLMIEVDNGVLFTGDIVLNRRVAMMDDGSFEGDIKAIDSALALPVKVVVPGHGASGGRELLTAQRDYLQTLTTAVKAQYDLGKSDYEMKPEVIRQLARFKDWSGFDEAIGKQISLVVLELEQSF
jgi:glyoxylase-like metal-dependent hydrolase (beta-lactamase superfamily II)